MDEDAPEMQTRMFEGSAACAPAWPAWRGSATSTAFVDVPAQRVEGAAYIDSVLLVLGGLSVAAFVAV